MNGFITLINFEKASDSIEWNFLFKYLKTFNFGDTFLNWIKILYTDIKSCVTNNGYYSECFKLSRSIRQGCPISALLFILVAEILAIAIRTNENIHGLQFNTKINHTYKIAQLADDTTLFLADLDSIAHSITLFDKFKMISGLTVNLEKTEIIPLGRDRNKAINLSGNLKKITYNMGPFKTLGIWFSNNHNDAIDLNYSPKIEKFKTLLQIWLGRHLSLKGKITILRPLIILQISFLFTVLFAPFYILEKLDKLLLSFLWSNKTPEVKRETIIASIEDGGLKMPDIFEINKAAKITWVKRLAIEEDGKWKDLTYKLLNIDRQHFVYKMPPYMLMHVKQNFINN